MSARRQSFVVTIEVDQGVPMPSRVVGLGVEARLLGDGFSGRITVTQVALTHWSAREPREDAPFDEVTSTRNPARPLGAEVDWENREVAW